MVVCPLLVTVECIIGSILTFLSLPYTSIVPYLLLSSKAEHSFRRANSRKPSVSNLVRASVAERVAVDVSGHKTRAVFDRYNIVNECDLRDAAQKLSRYLSAEFGHSSGIGSTQERKPELEKEANSFSDKEKDWLGGLETNLQVKNSLKPWVPL
jgi:hypothetical protein